MKIKYSSGELRDLRLFSFLSNSIGCLIFAVQIRDVLQNNCEVDEGASGSTG